MTRENIKQVLISLLVAAAAAFFSSLAQGLGDLIKAHAIDAVSGTVAATIYLAKAYKG